MNITNTSKNMFRLIFLTDSNTDILVGEMLSQDMRRQDKSWGASWSRRPFPLDVRFCNNYQYAGRREKNSYFLYYLIWRALPVLTKHIITFIIL